MRESQPLKKKLTWNEDSALRSAWRRIFSRSPIVREVLNSGRRTVPRFNKDGSRHKVDSVQFSCQVCQKWTPAKMIAVDHITPVIDVENVSGRIQDWNEFKRRLFCSIQNLQRICDECHNIKTQKERSIRQILKDKTVLDLIEINLKTVATIEGEKELKKQVSKFLSKTKSPETRERALRLKQILVDKITRED
jgi:5-methylcytosine-specific restriction endonuclease McrA